MWPPTEAARTAHRPPPTEPFLEVIPVRDHGGVDQNQLEAQVWARICRHAGCEFETKTSLPFTYRVRGNFLRITREDVEINRSLSRTNFVTAMHIMPVDGPGRIRERQGSAYTWAILMDPRIRGGLW